MTAIVASIGGLSFAIDDTSANTLATMRGWYSGPPKRDDTDDNPTSDGASPVSVIYKSARTITVNGLLSSVSADAAITGVWSTFAALQSDGKPSPFTVTDEQGTLSCLVSVRTNDIEPIADGLAEYVLQMTARDPVKYGLPRTLSTGPPTAGGGLEFNLFDGGAGGLLHFGVNGNLGRVTLTNAGKARVWPSLLVTGGLTTGFFVQRLDTGQVVRYDRVVPDGSTVSVNFRTGETLIDGLSDGSGFLTRYEFFSVGPGESVEVQFNPISGVSGSPTAAFTIADGFW